MIAEGDLDRLVDPKIKNLIFSKFSEYENIEGCLEELLKFLYLSSKYSALKRTFIPVTQEVDELWHCLILQTAYYQKLCSQLPGGNTVHHESMPFSQYKGLKIKKDLIVEILRWTALYVKNFGDLKEDRLKYWFFIGAVKDILNISLEEINRLARNDTCLSNVS